jgi:hypothetical protein
VLLLPAVQASQLALPNKMVFLNTTNAIGKIVICFKASANVPQVLFICFSCCKKQAAAVGRKQQ